MQNLIIHPVWLLVLFAVITAIFHVVFLKCYPLSERGWIKVEYVFLVGAVFGIVTASSAARIAFESNTYPLSQQRAEASYQMFRSLMLDLSEDGSYACNPGTRSEFSPPNFDDIEKMRMAACAWVKKTSASLPATAMPDFPDLGIVFPYENDADKISLEAAKITAENYLRSRAEMLEHKERAESSLADYMLLFFSPLALCIGVALQITKVSASLFSKK